MDNQDEKKVAEVKETAQQDQPSQSPQQNPNPLSPEVQEFIKGLIDNIIKTQKPEEVRKQGEEYNNKMMEVVQASQSSLIKPNMEQGESNKEYVRRILEQDIRERQRSSDGKTYYSDKGEDFVKAKIVILKKMGLSEEEIAKALFEN